MQGRAKKEPEENRPAVCDSSIRDEVSGKKGEEQRCAPDEKTGNAQNPEKATCPIKATTKWEVEEKPKQPTKTTSKRVRMPKKRYGIDLIQLDTESEN